MDSSKDKESSMSRKERDSFYDGLRRFHSGRGTHVRQLPTFGGHEVDLFQLYKQVTVRGGWGKVNEEQKWEEIAQDFHIPPGCVNASQALRYIYIRYLDVYEKVHYFGEDPDVKRTDGQDELPGQRKKLNYASAVPMNYNRSQHKLSDYMRQTLALPKHLDVNVYAKIEQSLVSGLPNEVDFAMNICTLLSSEGKHTLSLQRTPKLTNLMLAHIGVFDTGPGSMKQVYLESWKPASGHNFLRFWWESIEDYNIKKMICPEMETDLSPDDESNPPMSRVLNLHRDHGMYDKEGQRVIQVAMVLRNLSFEVENMKVLAANELFLRYIILAAHCNYHSVRQLALDTLGNIGLQMVLSPLESSLKCVIFTILRQCLLSADKFEVVTGLELLARLCQVPSNDEPLGDALGSDIYSRIVSYLTVHDIQLIAYTLECLYQLSELGEVTASQIARVSRAVATLVSLVTVEAQSYGPESIKGIRVVEHVPAGMPMPAPQSHATPQRQGVPSMVKAASTPSLQAAMKRPAAVPTPPTPVRAATVATPPPHQSAPPPVQQEISQTLTCRWLNAFYEQEAGCQVNKMEVYANYLKTLSKIGVNRVPDLREMVICIRMTFPRVDLVKIEKDNGSNAILMLKGIKPRVDPLPFDPFATSNTSRGFTQPPPRVSTPQGNMQSRPSTPQSNARLLTRPSTPLGQPQPTYQQQPHQKMQFPSPKPTPSTTIAPAQSQPTPPQSPPNKHPMLHQALLKQGDTNTSMSDINTPPSPSPTPPPVQPTKPADQALIKSLLANKLQQNMQKYGADTPQEQIPSQNGGISMPPPQVTHSSTVPLVVSTLEADMPPPSTVNPIPAAHTPAVSTSSSAFQNEFQQFMQTQASQQSSPQPAKRTRRKSSSTSPPKGKVKRSKSGDTVNSGTENHTPMDTSNADNIVCSKSQSDSQVSNATTEHLPSVNSTAFDNRLGNTVMNNVISTSIDNTPTINTTLAHCDLTEKGNTVNNGSQVGSHRSYNDTPSNHAHVDMATSKAGKETVFNGGCVDSQKSPKEISPSKFNASIEEKKARIAQLMKDTKILKEQLKGINGVSNQVLDNSTAMESNANESQEVETNTVVSESKLTHGQVNGFPETLNGNHAPLNAVDGDLAKHTEQSNNAKDLSSDRVIDMSATTNNEVLEAKGLSLDDLNRNNNCNGEGDSRPASPLSTTSSLPSDAGVPATHNTNPPQSVQSSDSLSSSALSVSQTVNTQANQQNQPMSASGMFFAPPGVPSGSAQGLVLQQGASQTPVGAQFIQANQVPGPITTPKVIMSAVPQTSQMIQPATGQVGSGQVPQVAITSNVQPVQPMNVQIPMQLAQNQTTQMMQVQQNQMVQVTQGQVVQLGQGQPQMMQVTPNTAQVVQMNPVVTQQGAKLVPQQVAPQILPQQASQVATQQVPVMQQVLTQSGQGQQQLLPQPNTLTTISAVQNVSTQQGQFVAPSVQPIVQQIQGQFVNQQNAQVFQQQTQGPAVNQQNFVISQQGSVVTQTPMLQQTQVTQQAGQVMPQMMTQAQITTPQGQVVHQTLPGQLVQQLIQAQLAQQQSNTTQQGQVVLQAQASQAPQTGPVLVHQAQNPVISQVMQGQVVVQAPGQNVPPVTIAIGQGGTNQISLQVGQVIQQQMVQLPQQQLVQGQVIAQQSPQQILPQTPQAIPQSVASSQSQMRYISQAMPVQNSQAPIQVNTQPLTTQNLALINQAQNSPSMQKSQFTVMQQHLHSSNPSITTPPPASPQSSRSSPGPIPSPGGKSAKRPPSRQSDAGDKPTKKKRRSRSKEAGKKGVSSMPSSPSPVSTAVPQQPMPQPMTAFQYVCEWGGCMMCFEASKQLQKHVIKTHFDVLDGYCYWQGCDKLRRQRFSLITHIQDKHLNEASLRAAALKRHQQAQSPGSSPASTPSVPPPVYPNDAAVQAIKRFAVKPPYPEFTEMKEGPVTKHIRLTSALILRNLAKYSALGRREIKKHEERLAYVALSPVESSAAISSCLAELA